MLRTKRKIIVSLHGIRTRGAWQKDLSPLISEQGWIYYPLDYGWFSVVFFIPGFFRKRKVEWFRARYNEIRNRYPDVIPSIVAHSFGTWILCKAMSKYKNLRFDKVILVGSIVPDNFDWKMLHDRNQFTSIRNDFGTKDVWAKFSKFFALGTGDSGFAGFAQAESWIRNEENPEYDHFSAFGYDHYLGEWIPFLGERLAFANGQLPWHSEEPVSPYDAARWSAISFFKQYIRSLANSLIRNDKAVDEHENLIAVKPSIVVLIPKTPGGAAPMAAERSYKENDLKSVFFKDIKRSAHVAPDGRVCDIPSTINTLLSLDERTDEDLVDAVDEFARTLDSRLNDADSDVKGMVTILRI